jgi:hypothetical protein
MRGNRRERVTAIMMTPTVSAIKRANTTIPAMSP